MKLLILCIAIGMAACGGCEGGSGTPPDAADAGQKIDAAPPYGFKVDTIDISNPNESGDNINNLGLSVDRKTLIYCNQGGGEFGGTLGFVDTADFSLTKTIDLRPLVSNIKNTGRCKITVIEEYAYVFYEPHDFDGKPAAYVIKTSLADQSVAAVWQVPDAYITGSWNQSRGLGVQATSDPNSALLMTSRSRSILGIPDGISAIRLNLTTGEFSEELLIEQGPVRYIDVYAVVDNKLFGLVKLISDFNSTLFLVDIDTKELLWQEKLTVPLTLSVHQQRKQILIAEVPSSGWSIFDALTGNLVRKYEYITGGFSPYALWMPNSERIVHITSASNGNGTMTIVNEADGSFVADLVVPLQTGFGMGALVISDDGKSIYLGGSGALVRVTVPDDL